ncbi:MAG: hypothetical protein ABIS28_16940, partial [Caldimonas sp.]
MTRADDSGAEHDAYLRSALRHAPDASLAPPDALDDAILRRARSATAEAGVGSPAQIPLPRDVSRQHLSRVPSSGIDRFWSGLAGAWSWLARPAVASGFAGVMVATLVGVMWWGRPLDDAMPGRFEPSAPSAPAASAQDSGMAAMRSEPSKADAQPSPAEASGPTTDDAKLRREAAADAAQRPTAGALNRSKQIGPRESIEPASPPATAQAAPEILAKRRPAPAAFPDPSELRIEPQARERKADPDASPPTALAVPKAQSSATLEDAVPPRLTSEPRALNRLQLGVPRQEASSPVGQSAPAIGAAAPTSQETPTSSAASDSTAMLASRGTPDRLAPAPPRSPIIAAAPSPALTDRDVAASTDAAGAAAARKTERADAAR